MEDDQENFDEPEFISKSQKKREAEAAQSLGERLVTLNESQLKQLDLPETLYDAVKEAQSIHAYGGKKRQLQFIGKLMRDENLDTEGINRLFARIDGAALENKQAFKAIEQWRDKLVEQGDEAVSLLLDKYPQTDAQQIRQLVRNANNKKNEKLAQKSKKALFQTVKQIIENHND